MKRINSYSESNANSLHSSATFVTILETLALPLLGAKQWGSLMGPSTSKSAGFTNSDRMRHSVSPKKIVFWQFGFLDPQKATFRSGHPPSSPESEGHWLERGIHNHTPTSPYTLKQLYRVKNPQQIASWLCPAVLLTCGCQRLKQVRW